MKLSIIIPAYNEALRIERTLRAYHTFFVSPSIAEYVTATLIVVPNGCTDATIEIVQNLTRELSNVVCHAIEKAGKGVAIKEGFLYALTQDADLIGFVDADCATAPEAFYALIEQIPFYDGIIASRYMSGAEVYPQRPMIKRWGSKLIYEPLVRMVLGLSYYDLQCGAKVFKRHVIAAIAPLLTIDQWAFDIELLYLCHMFNFNICEIPTIWYDQDDSKLTMRSGMRMLSAIFAIRNKHIHLQSKNTY